MIKKAVVEEKVSPSVESGEPCRRVYMGEPVMSKQAAEKLVLPKVPIEEKEK